MKNKIIFHSILVICLYFTFSCTKDQQLLILNKNYIWVADFVNYCQGPCEEITSWENQEAKVKGYVMGLGNTEEMDNYFEKSEFYLQDIRNGMFMIVKVTNNKETIFAKINLAKKTDLFKVTGIAEPVIASGQDECSKGVVLTINNFDNITIEIQ